MAKPNAGAPLGQGGRFAALKQKLARKPGIYNPGALAAKIGRQKYGKKRFQAIAAKGRKSTKGSSPMKGSELGQGYRRISMDSVNEWEGGRYAVKVKK